MNRRGFLLAAALLPPDALAHGATAAERLRVTNRALGWTVLRDRDARPGARETGMVLIRVQRPVAPGNRPGHLAASLLSFRPFRFTRLPAEEALRAAGLPGTVIEAPAMGTGSREPVMVRAVYLFAPDRSFFIIASAPRDEWADIRPEMVRLVEEFRPGEGAPARR